MFTSSCQVMPMLEYTSEGHRVVHSGLLNGGEVTIRQPDVLLMPSYFTPLTWQPTATSGRSEDEKRVLTCPHCSKTFSTEDNLQMHKMVHKKEPGPINCKEGDNTYHAKGQLNLFMQTHSRERTTKTEEWDTLVNTLSANVLKMTPSISDGMNPLDNAGSNTLQEPIEIKMEKEAAYGIENASSPFIEWNSPNKNVYTINSNHKCHNILMILFSF